MGARHRGAHGLGMRKARDCHASNISEHDVEQAVLGPPLHRRD